MGLFTTDKAKADKGVETKKPDPKAETNTQNDSNTGKVKDDVKEPASAEKWGEWYQGPPGGPMEGYGWPGYGSHGWWPYRGFTYSDKEGHSPGWYQGPPGGPVEEFAWPGFGEAFTRSQGPHEEGHYRSPGWYRGPPGGPIEAFAWPGFGKAFARKPSDSDSKDQTDGNTESHHGPYWFQGPPGGPIEAFAWPGFDKAFTKRSSSSDSSDEKVSHSGGYGWYQGPTGGPIETYAWPGFGASFRRRAQPDNHNDQHSVHRSSRGGRWYRGPPIDPEEAYMWPSYRGDHRPPPDHCYDSHWPSHGWGWYQGPPGGPTEAFAWPGFARSFEAKEPTTKKETQPGSPLKKDSADSKKDAASSKTSSKPDIPCDDKICETPHQKKGCDHFPGFGTSRPPSSYYNSCPPCRPPRYGWMDVCPPCEPSYQRRPGPPGPSWGHPWGSRCYYPGPGMGYGGGCGPCCRGPCCPCRYNCYY